MTAPRKAGGRLRDYDRHRQDVSDNVPPATHLQDNEADESG